MVQERRINVFGRLDAIVGAIGAWSAYRLADRWRKPAGFAVPSHLEANELCGCLADLFREQATPSNGDVIELDGRASPSPRPAPSGR